MSIGAGREEERAAEFLVGDGVQVGGDTASETDSYGSVRRREDLDNAWKRCRNRPDRGEIAGGENQVDVPDNLPAPAQAPCDLDAGSEAGSLDRGRELGRCRHGRGESMRARSRSPDRDAAKEFFDAFVSEPLHLSNRALATGALEGIERVDPETRMQEPDFLQSQTGQAEAFTQTRREAGAQLFVQGEPARRDELANVGENRVSDSTRFAKMAVRDRVLQALRKTGDRARRVLVGPYFERVFARELHQRRGLGEDLRRLLSVHARILEGAPRAGIGGRGSRLGGEDARRVKIGVHAHRLS